MSAVPKRTLTPAEYLKIERKAQYKSEFWKGETYRMAGASPEHNIISLNIGAELRIQLKSRRSCTVYPSDLRVKISETGLYTYPDIVVVCGKPQFEENDNLLTPTVIVEVLLKSTETYDRGTKFQHYRTIESLKEYLLVAQDSYYIEHYVRQPDQQWLLSEARGPDAVIHLPSIECVLALSEVYDKVEFPTGPRLLKERTEKTKD